MPLYATKLVPNITKFGSPTISNTNVVSGFSTSKYFTALSNINASVFDIRFKIKFSASAVSGGQKVFCVGTQANEEKDLFVLVNNAGTYLYIKHKSSQFAGFDVINNGYCYFKFVSDGVTLSVYKSTTGYDNMTLEGTTPLDSAIQGPVYFGCEPNYTSKGAFGGSVYLEDTQITVNNSLWWGATKYGCAKIKDLYKGSTKIKKLYKGSTLVYQLAGYPSGTVLYSSDGSYGTVTLNVLYPCTISVQMCGGGGNSTVALYKGGSSGLISGTTTISAGTYTIVVGKNAQDTTFLGNTAGKGGNASKTSAGSGGTTTVVSSGLTGSNGTKGSTTGRIIKDGYNYGAGASGNGGNGKTGYCRITVV